MLYIIRLEDAPKDLAERNKRDAESRFQRTLERKLGGPDAVIQAYQAWRNAEETSEYELSDSQIGLVKQWLSAASQAQTEGFRELGESEAYFDIRLQC
ncbi:MAG: hypothetical protein ACTJHW_10665 [Paenalcaligenes sp.]|uniref:hypothetical protein n=1 Tax=Paenalcaligenes suwonensis TaxID=1202713 RepID=UPI00140AB39A|nr:hypothetical protein [Paenalcaligenes suwonensis]NHC62375.1 hypothetical protein [Paenalcaligenes suwonensis]